MCNGVVAIRKVWSRPHACSDIIELVTQKRVQLYARVRVRVNRWVRIWVHWF